MMPQRFPGLCRVLRAVSRPRVDADDEIRFHLEMRAQELIDRGLAPDEAHALAARHFGDVDAVRAQLDTIDTWETRRMSVREWFDARAYDVRFAARSLGRFPAVTATIVVTLALGVGANATMFGIVDGLLMRPPAYLHDAPRVGRVYIASTRDGVERTSLSFNYARYRDMLAAARSFDVLSVNHLMRVPVGTGEGTQELNVIAASAAFWRLFDARPVIGRFFVESEDAIPVGTPVVVLAYDYWQSHFGGSESAVGAHLPIGHTVFTVIGVAPPGFTGDDMAPCVAFVPVTTMAGEIFNPPSLSYTKYNSTWLTMFVRRKPDVSLVAAEADLSQAYRQSYIANHPNSVSVDSARPRAILAPVLLERGPQATPRSKLILWLFGVSLAVLLIACANVANLLLTSALRRRREIAVRIALGIGRGRLVAQLLVESLMLATLGAVAGLLVAQTGGTLLRRVLIPDVAWQSGRPDGRLVLFAGLVALVCGLAVGLVPAIRAIRANAIDDLKAGVREGSYRRTRLRMILLVGQGALSVALLVGAGLFTRSLQRAQSVDVGLDLDRVLVVDTHMRGLQLDSVQEALLANRLFDQARALHGVARVSRTHAPPFMVNTFEDIFVPGVDSTRLKGDFYLEAVTPDYFETVGTRVLQGRGITAEDRVGSAPVIVVSAPMAEHLWPGQNPIGRCVRVHVVSSPCRTVVGTVAEIRSNELTGEELHYYLPADQYVAPARTLLIRLEDPRNVPVQAIRKALQAVMPGSAYVTVVSLRESVDRHYRSWRLGAAMFSVFGALALLLASLGLYSVMAHDVTQRRHELGVRMALGAHAGDVLRLVIGDGMSVAVIGVAIGLVVVGIGARWLAPMLFGMSPYDPVVIGGVVATLFAVALLASLIPARRAAKTDPAIALRAD